MGRSASFSAFAPKRWASFWARSAVRLATVIFFGCCATKCVAASSIISPAPTNSTEVFFRSSNSRCARRTAAAAIDTECAPISVWLRTSLATAKVRWNSWCRWVPSASASCATRAASFIWPRICGSPSTIESRPEATRNAWRTAWSFGRAYR